MCNDIRTSRSQSIDRSSKNTKCAVRPMSVYIFIALQPNYNKQLHVYTGIELGEIKFKK